MNITIDNTILSCTRDTRIFPLKFEFMNFSNIYYTLISQPLLNILQGLYTLTGDTGVAIIILGTIVNLLMWPLFAKTYINGQKTKALQPLIALIREKYKDNPQEMLKQLGLFNKKHGISSSSVFLVLIFQLIFATGLWTLTRTVSAAETTDGIVRISGLYESLFGRSETNFEQVAFGFINIGDNASRHIWLPIVAAFFSFLYGYYSFKIAPKPKIISVEHFKTDKKTKSKKTDEDKKPSFDPEAFQKSMEFQTIYFIPAFMLFLNLSLTTGLNIYFTTVSVLSLIRQIFLTNYYAGHSDRLVDEITKSDPFLSDPHDEYDDETVPADITSQNEVPELVIKNPHDQPLTLPKSQHTQSTTKTTTSRKNSKKSLKKSTKNKK